MNIQRLCIFCGAKVGFDPAIELLTFDIAAEVSKLGISLICGGSSKGLMGVLSKAASENAGNIIGVFPNILNHYEQPSVSLNDLVKTECLQSRKQKMIELADAFLILPGGYGTLDEMFEVIVLRRLNINRKSIILMNYNGFWNPILEQIKIIEEKGFADKYDDLIIVVENTSELKKILAPNLTLDK